MGEHETLKNIKDNFNINTLNKNTSTKRIRVNTLSTMYDNVDVDDEYNDEECYFSDKGKTHQPITSIIDDEEDDEDDDEYYVETDNDQFIKSAEKTDAEFEDNLIELMKSVSS